jgi:hypothetical protein
VQDRLAASNWLPSSLVQDQPKAIGAAVAGRKKSNPAEDLIELVAMLPWWSGEALTLVS